jgi:hypothetical protein
MKFESLPTYAGIVAEQSKYCFPCLFSGGKWTAQKAYKDTKGVVKYHPSSCIFSEYQEMDKS